jgi:hypothetical protein
VKVIEVSQGHYAVENDGVIVKQGFRTNAEAWPVRFS